MKNTKKWYQSRTVWSGIAKIVAGLFTSISGLLAGEIEPQTFLTGVIATIWGLHDVSQRFKTETAIEVPKFNK